MKLSLGLTLTVFPTDRDVRPPFIKSVELCLGGEVIGELYVHSAGWKSPADEKAARREASKRLKAIRESDR